MTSALEWDHLNEDWGLYSYINKAHALFPFTYSKRRVISSPSDINIVNNCD